MNDKKTTRVLLVILTAAFLIRLWGTWNVSTTDEYNEVFEALRICSGHFNLERWIKRFYLYILAFEYGFYYIVGWLAGAFHDPMDFAAKIVRDMEPLFLLGRMTSVIAGALTVGLLFRIGEKFFSVRTAVIASLLLCLTVFHVDLSQQAKVDATLGLLITASFYFMFRILSTDSGNKWDYAWLGFFMALAVQTKINAITLFVPLGVALLYNYRDKKISLKLLGFFALFFLAGFVLSNPPVAIAPLKFAQNIIGLKRVYTETINAAPNELIGFLAYPLFYFRAMGPFIAIITVAAIVYAFRDRDPKKMVMISFIFAFFLMMGASKNLAAPYYLIPLAPVLYLLSGAFIDNVYIRITEWRQFSKAALTSMTIVFAVVCFWVPAQEVFYHDLSLRGTNTRYLARDWIETNIPFGSRILMDSGKSINSSAPPIAENRESIERTLMNARKNISEGKIVHEMVDRNALIYYELLLKTVPERAYDITSTMYGLKVETLDYYIANGYNYLIISEEMKNIRTEEYAKTNTPKIAEFYSSLDTDKRVQLIKTIAPTLENSGSVFLIYKVTGR
jgi:4-amino-4-deoxy-L-arabinose transferase-like glycosyltransferase